MRPQVEIRKIDRSEPNVRIFEKMSNNDDD